MVKRTILFVDDDDNLLSSLRRSLRKYKDTWEMEFCSGAKIALDLMGQKKIDLIIADYKMPDVNGLELLERVKNLYPQMYRVLMTGQSETEVYHLGKELAHSYLAKPCTTEEIVTVIQRFTNL